MPQEKVNNLDLTSLERTVLNQQQLLVQPYGNPNKLVIDLGIRIPPTQRVRYVPGVLETIKHAWIQYLALFLPALLLYKVVIGFLFKYKILEANIVGDLNNKRIF